MKGSRLQQWCYNRWWLIGMAALNCIMSVRWWDHDHGKETRQGLIFHSGELITSSHILYCSSKISLPTLHCCKPIYTWEQAISTAIWTLILCVLERYVLKFVVRGWENSWLQGMTSIYSIQEELILGLTWTWGNTNEFQCQDLQKIRPILIFSWSFALFWTIFAELMGCWDDGHTSYSNSYLNCNNMHFILSLACS